MKPKIYKPKNVLKAFEQYSHQGDGFREMIDVWKEKGFVDVVDNENPWIWFGSIGSVLLYDRKTLDLFPSNISYKIGLFAGDVPQTSQANPASEMAKNDANNFSQNLKWSVFQKHPKILDELLATTKLPDFDARSNDIVNIDGCDCDYETILKHRFATAENPQTIIALLALGVVPILENSKIANHFVEPLIENTHYISSSEMSSEMLISSLNKEKWNKISKAGQDWYEKYYSPKGAFEYAINKMEEFGIANAKSKNLATKAKIESLCTFVKENTFDQFKLMMHSLQTNTTLKNLPMFVVCDRKSQEMLLNNYRGIRALACLDFLNANEMEIGEPIYKCKAIDFATTYHKNTLFVQNDTVFLNDLPGDSLQLDKEIGLSKLAIAKENETKYGKYCPHFIWVNSQNFTRWWKSNNYNFDMIPEKFKYFEFPMQCNFGWKRLFQCEINEITKRLNTFQVENNQFFYDGKPMISIHTNFAPQQTEETQYITNFNRLMVQQLGQIERFAKLNNYIQTEFLSQQKKKVEEYLHTQTEVKENLQHNDTMQTQSQSQTQTQSQTQSQSQTQTQSQTQSQSQTQTQSQEPKGMPRPQGMPGQKSTTKDAKDLPNNKELKTNTTSQPQQGKKVNIIVQYYNDKNPERQQELDYCMLANLHNEHVANVWNLVEKSVDVPDEIKNHPKYKQHTLGKWMTYKDAFDFANENLIDEIVCLCNLDIFLDYNSDWAQCYDLLKQNIVLCLSRYEYLGPTDGATRDRELAKLAFAHTQDAWVFCPRIFVQNCDFELGRLGCDNAIADRLNKAQYIPLNWCNKFKIFHYDVCRKKTGKNFMSVHHSPDETNKIKNKNPEQQGYMLLPDFDMIKSVDKLISQLTPIQKYKYICQIMTDNIKIDNRPRKIV